MKLDKEKQLIEASQLDKVHFAPLYKEYVADVYRYAYSIVNSKDIAEEIASETFTRALERIDNFEWRGTTIKTWFFSIARNVSYEKMRESGDIELDEENQDFKEYEEINSDSTGEIDIKLQKDLKDLLQQLPSLTREVIVLRIWEEYKYSEIAEIVDRSEDSVKKQFYRGVAKLRELLKEKGHDESNIALPIIFVGIEQVGRLEIFKPEEKLVSLLENNLNLIKNGMENNTMKNSTASSNVETVGNVVSESTTKPKNLSLFGVEIPVKTVLLGTVALLVIGVGIGGMYLAGQLGQGEVEEENEQKEVEKENIEGEDDMEWQIVTFDTACTHGEGNATFEISIPQEATIATEYKEFVGGPQECLFTKIEYKGVELTIELVYELVARPADYSIQIGENDLLGVVYRYRIDSDSNYFYNSNPLVCGKIYSDYPSEDQGKLCFAPSIDDGKWNDNEIVMKSFSFIVQTATKDEEILGIFDKVVLSLDIRKETKSDKEDYTAESSSAWKLYDNPTRKVRFSYPSDWDLTEYPVADTEYTYDNLDVIVKGPNGSEFKFESSKYKIPVGAMASCDINYPNGDGENRLKCIFIYNDQSKPVFGRYFESHTNLWNIYNYDPTNSGIFGSGTERRFFYKVSVDSELSVLDEITKTIHLY